MTIIIIEDKTIEAFKTEVAEIINDKLSCISVGFNNFIKITPNIKHIFIDGVDVLPYYKKGEIK